MAFTVNDFEDLLRLLRENPEWQAQLREIIVGDDFKRIEAGFELIREEMRESRRDFDERMRALEARMEAFDHRMQAFDQRMQAFDQRMQVVDGRLQVVDGRLTSVERRLGRVETTVGDLTGFAVEDRLRRKATGYFGRVLRKARVFAPADLPKVQAANDADALSDAEWTQLNALDFVVLGLSREGGQSEVALAVEASSVIDLHDVNRAVQRAEILSKVGYEGRPAVGGASILDDAKGLAERLNVLVVLNPGLALATAEASDEPGAAATESNT